MPGEPSRGAAANAALSGSSELVERDRITAALRARAGYPVTLVDAPAGFGKSTAVAHYLAAYLGPRAVYRVPPAHRTFPRFVRGLAAALEPLLPGVRQSLLGAYERALQSTSTVEAIAGWLAEHLRGAEGVTIVLDDLQHVCGEPAIAQLVATLIDRAPASVRWIVATRGSADLPLASWLAHVRASLPLDAGDLALRHDEAVRIAASAAPGMPVPLARRLNRFAEGCASTYVFALRTVAESPHAEDRLDLRDGTPFERIAQWFLEDRSPAQAAAIELGTALPALEGPVLEAAGVDGASALLDALVASAPWAFARLDGRLVLHAQLREHAASRLERRGRERRDAVHAAAAAALERTGALEAALGLLLAIGAREDVLRVASDHAFAFIETGAGELAYEALDTLDPLAQTTSPVLLAVKAMRESRTGRFDTAESWFQLAMARAGGSPHRAEIAFHYASHLLRFFRPEALDVLAALARDPGTSPRMRAYAQASLGPTYVLRRLPAEADACIAEAMRFAADSPDAHLVAKVHHQAAFVALYAGDAARAVRLATISLERATAMGYFDIAGGALSVLCNVATDLDDDPVAGLGYLERVAENAAKSGSLVNAVRALVASLEIEAERGDVAAAARLDAELAACDVRHVAERAALEALLPTQALRASWLGDFRGAYRILATSADAQWSADRKALRWAEIALYAAGAGLPIDAERALEAAAAELATLEHEPDVRVARARLTVAATLVVLGRGGAARAAIDRALEFAPPGSARVAAFARMVRALEARWRGARNHADMLAAAEEMRARHLGGVAVMIMALPYNDTTSFEVLELSRGERTTLADWALGDGAPPGGLEDRETIARLVARLGHDDGDSAARFVLRNRRLFEAAAVAEYGA